MMKLSAPRLAKKSPYFRYAYYVVTSFRIKSFRSWKRAGEPNPFVVKTYRHKGTEQVEFCDILKDILREASPSRSTPV